MKNILIVEDDPDMQEIYKSMFEGEKECEVEIIGDAGKALKRLDAKGFDAIVLDIIMEPMSGDSFYVHLRNSRKARNTPVIVVTILKKDTLEFLEKLDGFTYLQKPITKEKLMKRIEEIAR